MYSMEMGCQGKLEGASESFLKSIVSTLGGARKGVAGEREVRRTYVLIHSRD